MAPDPANDREAFARQIDAFVRSMAEFPELNRMMVHESTVDSDRLRWIVEHHTKLSFETITSTWRRFRQSRTVRAVDEFVLYDLLIGAASLPYVSAAEAALLGQDTADSSFIDAHVAALVEMLSAPSEGP